MTSPVVFTLTNAGINAAIDAEGPGLSITVSELAIGTGQYVPSATATALQAETHRFPLAGAGVNAASHTLQFTSVLEATSQTDAFEIGLFTDTGILFAVASTTGADPLVVLYAGIAFVASFGLSLTGVPAGTVTVSVDPTASIAASMLQQHLAASNPHPQYASVLNVAASLDALLESLKIKVNDLYLTTTDYVDGSAVATALGYGTWERYAEGLALVGRNPDEASAPYWTKNFGLAYGDYEHMLTVDEMPSHVHEQTFGVTGLGIANSVDPATTGTTDGYATTVDYIGTQTSKAPLSTKSTGDGEPFNIVQPSIVIGVWRRTA